MELPYPLKIAASNMLAVSVWSFTFALTFGAWTGHRGIARGKGGGALATYAANMTGVVLSTVSILMLAYGAAVHFLRAFSQA